MKNKIGRNICFFDYDENIEQENSYRGIGRSDKSKNI